MKKGRSNYTLQFNCDENKINQLMQSYLSANGFVSYEKKGEQYFRAGDQMMGYKGLIYFIQGQQITINAWLDGALGNFPLEQNSLNVMAMNYRNSLSTLFKEIEGGNTMNNNVNNGQMNFDPNTGQPINQNIQQTTGDPVNQINTEQPQNNFSQTFQDENQKKQEKMCEIGFWLSILGLVCSFFGVAYSIFVYIIDFYFASQGLKTKKRGKAIATIVLSIISILIIIIELIVANS